MIAGARTVVNNARRNTCGRVVDGIGKALQGVIGAINCNVGSGTGSSANLKRALSDLGIGRAITLRSDLVSCGQAVDSKTVIARNSRACSGGADQAGIAWGHCPDIEQAVLGLAEAGDVRLQRCQLRLNLLKSVLLRCYARYLILKVGDFVLVRGQKVLNDRVVIEAACQPRKLQGAGVGHGGRYQVAAGASQQSAAEGRRNGTHFDVLLRTRSCL